ncbi:LexA family transcriptional regulator [Chitinimonas arctica]|uniref:LexA family transcriptional regulator n=1 Tax=Chitinimonas arctica TaxID=2594795 RepID=A0A516SJJ8_9NEIS|nr:LexA family transcriptional regulator [Chitinimonas arctica]QDQ28218.1 LexA family transcriptional regulator [Chitinimonas arctica]
MRNNTNMRTLSERLLYAIEQAGVTQADLARHLGVPRSTVNQWFSGRSKNLSAMYGARAAAYLGVDPLWLASGEERISPPGPGNIVTELRPTRVYDEGDPLDDDEVEVGRLTLTLHAGTNRLQWEIDTSETLRYSRSWCNRKGFEPSKLATILADGDSMSPEVKDGATVTVNTDDVKPRSGYVYAVDYQGAFYFKRLFVEPDGAIRASSDNPDKVRHPDWVIKQENADALSVIGRAVQVQNDM